MLCEYWSIYQEKEQDEKKRLQRLHMIADSLTQTGSLTSASRLYEHLLLLYGEPVSQINRQRVLLSLSSIGYMRGEQEPANIANQNDGGKADYLRALFAYKKGEYKSAVEYMERYLSTNNKDMSKAYELILNGDLARMKLNTGDLNGTKDKLTETIVTLRSQYSHLQKDICRMYRVLTIANLLSQNLVTAMETAKQDRKEASLSRTLGGYD